MAMLHLAVENGLRVQAVTVDHGLRAGSAAEAAFVGRVCARLAVPHRVLRWLGWDGQGNLQDQARRARRRLIADWAVQQGLGRVALAHTRDDLAETFLMRLARGAGVDGLAAMAPQWSEAGVIWHRPMLAMGRAELRGWLTARGIDWLEDPSNENTKFDRVKARRALQALAPLGLSAETLAEVAGHLACARAALEAMTDLAAQAVLRIDGGDVLLDAGFAAQPEEIQRRLLQRAILWITSAEYGPRGASLTRIRQAVVAGKPGVLAGCRFLPAKTGTTRITREARAVAGLACPVSQLWDGRWRISGPGAEGQEIRALGAAGLAQLPDWHRLGRPRAALLALPAVWRGDRLIAAPLAGQAAGYGAELQPGAGALIHSALSH